MDTGTAGLIGACVALAGTVASLLYNRVTAVKVEGVKSELVWGLNAQQSRLGIVSQMELKLYEKSLDSYVRTRAAFAESARLIGHYAAAFGGDVVDWKAANETYDAALRSTNEARTACILVPVSCKERVRALLDSDGEALSELYVAQSLPKQERWQRMESILRRRIQALKNARGVFDEWQDLVEQRPRDVLAELQRPPALPAREPCGAFVSRLATMLLPPPSPVALPPPPPPPDPPATRSLVVALEHDARRRVTEIDPLCLRHSLLERCRGCRGGCSRRRGRCSRRRGGHGRRRSGG